MASEANSYPEFFVFNQIHGFQQDKQLNLIMFQNIFKIYIEWNSNNLKQQIALRNHNNKYFPEKSIWYVLQSFIQILQIYYTHKLTIGKINTIYIQIKPNAQICLFDTKLIQNSQAQYFKNHIDYARPLSHDLKIKNHNDYVFKIGLCLVGMITLVDPSLIYIQCKNLNQFNDKIKMYLQSVKYKYSQNLIQFIKQMINKENYTHVQLKLIKKSTSLLSGKKLELLTGYDKFNKRERIYTQNHQMRGSQLRCIYVVSSESKQNQYKNSIQKEKMKEKIIKNKKSLLKQQYKENEFYPQMLVKKTQNNYVKSPDVKKSQQLKKNLIITSLNLNAFNENSITKNNLNVPKNYDNNSFKQFNQRQFMKKNSLEQMNNNNSKNNIFKRQSFNINCLLQSNDKLNNNKSNINICKPNQENQFINSNLSTLFNQNIKTNKNYSKFLPQQKISHKLFQDLQFNNERKFIRSKNLQNIRIDQNINQNYFNKYFNQVNFQKNKVSFDQGFIQIPSNPHFIEKQYININKINKFQQNYQQKQNFDKYNYKRNDLENYSKLKNINMKNQPYTRVPTQRETQLWENTRKINHNPYINQKKLKEEQNKILEGRFHKLDMINFKSLKKYK